MDYLRKKLTGVYILKESSEYNLQNRLEKKTPSKLLKYRKIPLIRPCRIYGQETNFMGLYWLEKKEGLYLEGKTLQFFNLVSSKHFSFLFVIFNFFDKQQSQMVGIT